MVEVARPVEERHRAEELGPRDVSVGQGALENRGYEIPAWTVAALAATEDRRACRRGTGDGAEDALQARLADHRLGGEGARLGDEAVAERLVDLVEDDDPTR